MRRGVRRPAIAAAWLAVLAGLAVLLVFADPVGILFYASYAGIGGFLVMRRPHLAVGWLLVLEGVAWASALSACRPTRQPSRPAP